MGSGICLAKKNPQGPFVQGMIVSVKLVDNMRNSR